MSKVKFYIVFIFVVSFFSLINEVKADYSAKIVRSEPCKLYYDSKGKTATGSCIYSNTKFSALTTGPYWVDIGDKVKVITSKGTVKAPTSGYGSECKSTFSYISIDYASKTYYGYVCTDNIWDGVVTTAMQTKFKNAGFPSSYWDELALLSVAHPTWKFVAIDTELDFKTAVNNEDKGNKSLIQYTSSTNDVGYLSTEEGNYSWEKDKYTVYDGSTWYAANNATIAYFMDPRNFLNDSYIFQFEPLVYEASNNHLSVINALLKGQYISKYAQTFVTSGASAKVSPVYLAALSKQEIGGSTANTAIKGGSFTYGGKSYSGLYNFYNIGATSGDGAVYRGLVYANGGSSGSDKTYSRPWTTPEKAILGGAQFIYTKYLSTGQNTSYFKKWNVVYNYAKKNGFSPKSNYTNQYMQNIQAPRSEANSTYKSYSSLDLLDTDFTFYIPVYKNMPASTSLPKKGSPNNYLKNLTINLDSKGAKTVTGFAGAKTNYTVHVANDVKTAVVAATKVNSNASISGAGTKNLVVGNNVFNIVVTAQNGTKRIYKLTIVKEAADGETYKSVEDIVKDSSINIDDNYMTGLTLTTSISSIKSKVNSAESKSEVVIKRSNKQITSGNLRTGDAVTIKSGNDSKTYNVVIYGDLSSDGKISAVDLLKVQKDILGTTKLKGAYAKAADINKDGKITAVDLLKVQKHILGDKLISQK